jgi:hypothetical protein
MNDIRTNVERHNYIVQECVTPGSSRNMSIARSSQQQYYSQNEKARAVIRSPVLHAGDADIIPILVRSADED